MRLSKLTLALLVALAGLPPLVAPARAQSGEFAPVLTVNGLPITGYELDQRMKFLKILGATGDLAQMAETALIEDRLRKSAAKAAGIASDEQAIRAGMEEFAGRANLSTEQFVQAIGQGGVDAETFRDFVDAGVLWRSVIRQKFSGTIRLTNANIDRALSATEKRGAGPRVLLSEIVIPIKADNGFVAEKQALDLKKALSEGQNFADAARKLSAAPSRDKGGQLGWIPLTNLPAGVQAALATLKPGQISEPLQVPGGIAIFQLRGAEQGGPEVSASNMMVDYLTLTVPGQAEAAKAQAAVGTCDDMFTFARNNRSSRLTHETQRPGAVPGDIAQALSAMDENETALLSRGGVPVVVMLCSRTAFTAEGSEPSVVKAAEAASEAVPFTEDGPPRIDADLGFGQGPSRDAVRSELSNVRLSQLADQYLAQLKATAIINRAP